MGRLETKIRKESIKEKLEDFEIKALEVETEIKTETLKQTEKTVRKKNRRNKLKLKQLEIKEIMEKTTEKN